MERIKKAKKILKKLPIEGMLITRLNNIFYLSGFTGDAGLLYLTPKKAFFISDLRFEGMVEKEVKDSKIILTQKGYFQALKEVVSEKIIGYEESISYGILKSLKTALKGIKLKSIKNFVEDLRIVKDEKEIKLLKQAAHIGDKALKNVLPIIKPGIKERDIAIELEYQMRKFGGDGISFTTIVASGIRGATPHARASNKRIKSGTFITMDFGTYYKRYASDMTRTVALGNAPQENLRIYNLVYTAQRMGVDAVKAGMSTKKLDSLVRDYLTKAGYGKYFTHSLGHGVGLDVHEQPFVSYKSDTILKENMVITIEPGLYIKGKAGVRIEDTVMVKKDGCVRLTLSPKKLIKI